MNTKKCEVKELFNKYKETIYYNYRAEPLYFTHNYSYKNRLVIIPEIIPKHIARQLSNRIRNKIRYHFKVKFEYNLHEGDNADRTFDISYYYKDKTTVFEIVEDKDLPYLR